MKKTQRQRGDVSGDVYDEVLMMKMWGVMEIDRITVITMIVLFIYCLVVDMMKNNNTFTACHIYYILL